MRPSNPGICNSAFQLEDAYDGKQRRRREARDALANDWLNISKRYGDARVEEEPHSAPRREMTQNDGL
jgi:hypothetical protein